MAGGHRQSKVEVHVPAPEGAAEVLRTILVVGLLVVVGLVVLGLVERRRAGRSNAGWRIDRTARVVCKACHGSGWISPQHRTLEFGPGGFADQRGPAEPCSACRGTGVIARK